MASFFFKTGEQVDADDAIVADPQYTAEVAAHPIESGSQLGDHISPAPPQVSLDLVFTPDAAGRERVFPAPGATRPDTAVARLAAACRSGEVLATVIFANLVWDDVALVSVRPSRNSRSGDGREVQVVLQQLRVAEARTVTVGRVRRVKRRPSSAVKARAAAADRGSIPSTEVMTRDAQLIEWRDQMSLIEPELPIQSTVP